MMFLSFVFHANKRPSQPKIHILYFYPSRQPNRHLITFQIPQMTVIILTEVYSLWSWLEVYEGYFIALIFTWQFTHWELICWNWTSENSKFWLGCRWTTDGYVLFNIMLLTTLNIFQSQKSLKMAAMALPLKIEVHN